jgi:hypothetical protein
MTMRQHLLVLTLALAACSPGEQAPIDPALIEGLRVDQVGPELLLPRSRLVVLGESFVGEEWGRTRLSLVGSMDGLEASLELPLAFVDETRMEVIWPGGGEAGLPASSGTFVGEARLLVYPRAGGPPYESGALPVSLEVAGQVTPQVTSIVGEDTFTAYAWDRFVVQGDGFLLGGEEGQTVAVFDGCLDEGGGCLPITPAEAPLEPVSELDRGEAIFRLPPDAVGLGGGHFQGTITLENRAPTGALSASPQTFEVDVLEPQVTAFSPQRVSLGQYMFVQGGGFVPTGSQGQTTLTLAGEFTPTGGTDADPVDETVEVEGQGRRARYVVQDEDGDQLSLVFDSRGGGGTFVGTAQVHVTWNGVTVDSPPANVTLEVGPMRQIVWVRFMPGYVQSLRYYGLRAVDHHIRQRALTVMRLPYQGTGVEFREDEPEDFALYTTVEVVGHDPGGKDLFGYDNTPGKDVGNERVNERIGGINAETQADGSRGYGGVFMESFFGYSLHGNGLANQREDATALFDQIFDPFRPDMASEPVRLAEIQGGVLQFANGDACPADSRREQISCAIWVMGSLMGGTTAHEVAHSLGLANADSPDTDTVHNQGDEPNRLMDSGGARDFAERAELGGKGPGVFCVDDYEYLRRIMPSDEPPPDVFRPECF